MSVSATLDGVGALKQRATALSQHIKDIVQQSFAEGGAIIAEEARQRVSALRDADRPGPSTLGDSIRVDADGDDVVVMAGAAHAPFVEFGTRHMAAQPFLGPAFATHKDIIKDRTADAIADAVKEGI